ncbi:MAG: hypothetical protein NTW03_14140 [Verrucomicrobia bacterium]|nr:hypothetical protein [Verrucomicrobiota bacterium]
MSKRYQARKQEARTSAALMGAWLIGGLVVLLPVLQAWGTSWWIDAIIVALVVVVPGVFVLFGLIFLRESTLQLDVDDAGLWMKKWHKSRRLLWSDVTAWCAVEVYEELCLIYLQPLSARKPVAIDASLLDGKQFANIYRDIEEHCGPPRPGAELLGNNGGVAFTDKHP